MVGAVEEAGPSPKKMKRNQRSWLTKKHSHLKFSRSKKLFLREEIRFVIAPGQEGVFGDPGEPCAIRVRAQARPLRLRRLDGQDQ